MIIIGKGKHVDIVKNIAILNKFEPIIISYEEIYKYNKNDKYFIAIGDNKLRKEIFEKYPNLNYINLIHPFSSINNNVTIGNGNLICPGVIIQPESQIGNHCIINTKSSLDHHNIIGDFVHICPNVTSCGNVTIGKLSTIGPSSTICHNTSITNNCIIGASSLVLKNIEKSGKYWGIPCKFINNFHNIH